jgi:hypothetical protein
MLLKKETGYFNPQRWTSPISRKNSTSLSIRQNTNGPI